MEDRKSNVIQVLNLLYLIKKLDKIKKASCFDELFYLTYLYEISKKNIDIARVKYTDPTGLADEITGTQAVLACGTSGKPGSTPPPTNDSPSGWGWRW